MVFRQFTVHWTKISYWGHNKTKRGIPIYRLLSRYICFWQKIRFRFSKLPSKVIPFISGQFTAHWTKISCTYLGHNKTKRAIPICRSLSRYTVLMQKYVVAFNFVLIFNVRFSSSSKKRTVQQIHVVYVSNHSKKHSGNTNTARQQEATLTGQQPGRNSNNTNTATRQQEGTGQQQDSRSQQAD